MAKIFHKPEESLASVEHATERALLDGRITWLVQDGEPGSCYLGVWPAFLT